MKYGYVRVSTKEQNEEKQVDQVRVMPSQKNRDVA